MNCKEHDYIIVNINGDIECMVVYKSLPYGLYLVGRSRFIKEYEIYMIKSEDIVCKAEDYYFKHKNNELIKHYICSSMLILDEVYRFHVHGEEWWNKCDIVNLSK